ncbi:MAG: hypothetical protein AB8I08_11760 [Sandaracinaceae bacterium]
MDGVAGLDVLLVEPRVEAQLKQECPSRAWLVVGTSQAALGRHLARARRHSFRVAVVGLVSTGLAAVSILVAI